MTFQQEVCDTVGLGNVTCLSGRAEEESALRESFEVVTSRAVARMTMLCELCLPLVRVGGVFAAMKGPEPEEEVQEAARCIRTLGGGKPRIEKYTVPGTDAVHSVVIIPKTAPTPAKYPRRFAMIMAKTAPDDAAVYERALREPSPENLAAWVGVLEETFSRRYRP